MITWIVGSYNINTQKIKLKHSYDFLDSFKNYLSCSILWMIMISNDVLGLHDLKSYFFKVH